ncbi:MAG: hypothetical protein EBW14_13935, partial [Oxalobacteraceae bacterium]|nr:hypothetical protein [Oxalobacteraceae bacterium]
MRFTPADADNYSILIAPVSVTVNKVTPTILTVPTATPITYGQTLADSTLMGGLGSVSGSFAWFTADTVPNAGTAAQDFVTSQAFVFVPDDTMNYDSVIGSVQVEVSQALATVALDNLSADYDGTPKVVSVTTTPPGLLVNVTYNGQSSAPVGAGSYEVLATIDDANYAGSKSMIQTIAPKAVTVTADAKSKEYGAEDPELTYLSSGLLGSDVFTGSLVREAGESAGVYAIEVGSLSAGANYSLVYTGANFTIQASRRLFGIGGDPLGQTTSSVVTLSGNPSIQGIACDGTRIFVNSSSTEIHVYDLQGALLGSHAVTNLATGNNQMAFANGYLFARNGDTLYRISTADWSSTPVAVDGARPLLTCAWWMYGSLFDTPDGKLGVMGPTLDGQFTVRLYQLSSDGLTLTWEKDQVFSDPWATDEHGMACDGFYFYRMSMLDGCRVYDLESG